MLINITNDITGWGATPPKAAAPPKAAGSPQFIKIAKVYAN